MASGLIAILRVFTISRVRNRIFDIKFCYLFVIVKDSTTNRFIILVTNDREFLIFKISRNRRDNNLSLNILGKLINSIPLLTN